MKKKVRTSSNHITPGIALIVEGNDPGAVTKDAVKEDIPVQETVPEEE